MKKILFLILVTFNSFAFDCELVSSSFVEQKSIVQNSKLSFIDLSVGNEVVLEHQISADEKIQLVYKTVLDPIGETRIIDTKLSLLKHKGGNGYTAISSSLPSTKSLTNGVLKFDLNTIFGNRSESLDYQPSERMKLQDYVLECFIL